MVHAFITANADVWIINHFYKLKNMLTMLSPGCDWVVILDIVGGFDPFMMFKNSKEMPSYNFEKEIKHNIY